jgi:hypothetical protein
MNRTSFSSVPSFSISLTNRIFGSPVAVLTNPSAGQVLGAGPGRVIQFGLRYSF